MGNKKNHESRNPARKSRWPAFWIAGAIGIAVAVLALSVNHPSSGGEPEDGKSFQITTKETRPVLDPALFSGMTRSAYAAAQKYPDLMNEVFCYCYCHEPPVLHETLLSCFTDRHGEG